MLLAIPALQPSADGYYEERGVVGQRLLWRRRRYLYSGSAMLDAIETKKRGEKLPTEVIQAVVACYTSGERPDYQMSALLTAIFVR
jgi:hypothetical protein